MTTAPAAPLPVGTWENVVACEFCHVSVWLRHEGSVAGGFVEGGIVAGVRVLWRRQMLSERGALPAEGRPGASLW